MSIETLRRTFAQISQETLPALLALLRKQVKSPEPLQRFASSRYRLLCTELGYSDDLKGCYVILDGDSPIYVGISRWVIKRLRQHVTGKSHYSASLAYRMACSKYPHEESRDDAMDIPDFRLAFEEAQNTLRSCSCAFIKVEDAVERYLFEVFCALEFNTERWNSFETH